jgi:integrase
MRDKMSPREVPSQMGSSKVDMTQQASGSQVKLLMPLLGETGCRLAEIVGLELHDIDIVNDLIHIRPKSIRRLKTPNSKRTLPLVGYAKVAMKLAFKQADEKYIYPRYLKDGTCRATHASAALGKWLKKDFNGLQLIVLGIRLKTVSELWSAR